MSRLLSASIAMRAVAGGGVSCVVLAVAAGCQTEYRIGEQVLVEYGTQQCSAFVVGIKSKTRIRVHFVFEGYDWEDNVSVDRVLGKLVEAVRPCSLPRQVRLRLGLKRGSPEKSRTSPYRVGERVRVRWRGSVYSATVKEVVASDQLLVHYLGHENAWDETIAVDRIVAARR